ncbi:MAG: DUF1735 domain-containing protein [Chitinophagaceae bacterium]
MKRNFNLSTIVAGAIFLITVATLSSCIKNWRPGETQFNNLQPVVLIPEGGLAGFSGGAITFPGTDPADTTYFHVNYAATNVAPADETVTLGIDQPAIDKYNSTSGIKYDLMPDSVYSFTAKQVTVKAGNNYTDPIPLIIYPNKIDPSKSYMLPISITASPAGSIISGNYGTLYYHVIGNPIAGAYKWDFTRIPTQDGSGPPDISFTGNPTIFAPVSPTQFEVRDGYYIQPRYEVTFDNNNGVLSNFAVSLNADDVATMAAAGVSIIQAPKILIADPVNKVFEFQYVAFNGSAYRYCIDKYYK